MTERAEALEALARARQKLTMEDLEKYVRLGARRRTWEFRLLVDWYVLLDRSLAMVSRDDD